MVNFAGFGAVYPGYQQAERTSLQNRGLESDLVNADLDRAGAAALGRTFQALMPGAQPMPPMQPRGPAPQPPMPGQASVPMQQPQAAGPAPMGQGAPPMAQPMAPSPMQTGGATPSGMQPGTQFGGFDLDTAWRSVAQANPGAKPEVIVSALMKGLPYLNAQAQQQVAQMNARIRGQEFGLHERQFGETQRHNLAAEDIARTKGTATTKGGLAGQFVDDYMQNNPGATMDEALKAYQRARTPAGQQLKEAQGEAGTQNVLSQIDSALTQLEESKKGGPKVTGLIGTGRRLYEGIGGSLGMTSETAASDFETKIRLIQAELPRLIAQTSRISKDERAKLDQIVRGLDRFTSPDQAISSLNFIKKVITNTVGSEKLKAPGATPEGEGGTKNLTPEIRKAAQGAMQRNGWTRQQVIDTLREQGYDTRGF